MQHEYILSQRGVGRTLRGTNDEPEILLAVSPDNRIKTLRYSTNSMPSKLTCKTMVKSKRVVGIQYVTLTEEARQQGWRTLEEMYEAEGRMEDCETVYKWYRAASSRKSGKIEPLDKAYLPDALLELQRAGHRSMRLDLPPPQRSEKPRAKHKADAG